MLHWPCSMMTNEDSERRLAVKLKSTIFPPNMRKLARNLPSDVLDRIRGYASDENFTFVQALSLRRNLLKKLMGIKAFMQLDGNTQNGQKDLADEFEMETERFLQSLLQDGQCMVTEKEMRMQGHTGPTPDFVFNPPLHVNGTPVFWMDCKNMYGTFCLRTLPWQPERKLASTAARYNAAFGPGAFLFANGFCRELSEEVVDCLLLDATPLTLHSAAPSQEMGYEL